MSSHNHFISRVFRFFIGYVLPVLVIIVGIKITKMLISSAPEPERYARENLGTLVTFTQFEPTDRNLIIEAQGEVIPSQRAVIRTQVSGRVAWQNQAIIPGGIVHEGEELIHIDDSEFDLLVSQQRAVLNQAESLLELEQGRQEVASREFSVFQDDIPIELLESSLALRVPQLNDAEARVDVARAGLQLARLNLERTTLTAPFNGFIQVENTEIGDLIGPSSALMTLIGTNSFWVQSSIPIAHIPYMTIPGLNRDEIGSQGRISLASGVFNKTWEGRVIQLMPDLEPTGRMARVLIQINNPLGLGSEGNPPVDRDNNELPLLLGSYVDVSIVGDRLTQVYEIPRGVLHEGNRLYLMTPDNTLEIRDVDITWRLPDSVLIETGITPDDRIINSHLGTAVPGMPLRTESSVEQTGEHIPETE
jgi:hypothetical protein